jgi:hypothetical protein
MMRLNDCNSKLWHLLRNRRLCNSKQLDIMHEEVNRGALKTADVIGVIAAGLDERISVLRRVWLR